MVSVKLDLDTCTACQTCVNTCPMGVFEPDGDKVVVTMVGRGVSIPDTRPAVVVSVQETATSDPVEYVLTAQAGTGRPG